MKNKKSLLVRTACAVGGAVAVAGFAVFYEIMHRDASLPEKFGKIITKQSEPSEPPVPDERQIWFNKQALEDFQIINAKGFRLKAFLLPADEPSDVYVFCSHGYRNCGSGEFNRIVKFYHDKGYNVFLVDHQAAGESEGKFIGFGYHEHRDCLQWIDFMKNHFGKDIQIILHGISMGSATVMIMAGSGRLPENVKFVVADCGYTSAYDQFVYNTKNMHLPAFPVINAANFFNRIISGYDFRDANPLESVKKAKVPMLFIHGKKDDFVPFYMVNELYNACSSEHKELLAVDGAAHAESYPADSVSYENKVNGFAEKYILQNRKD